MKCLEFDQFSLKAKKILEAELSTIMDEIKCPGILKEAMHYSLQAGGKRIRPLLLFATMDSLEADWQKGVKVAAAIEMIHTYSLIHDDLPSMDDDDLRRGKPTNHKVFGEAIAILAGDALLTQSFRVLSALDSALFSDRQKLEIIACLSQSAGAEGMVGGQVADLLGEEQQVSLEELESIHIHKTGKLLAACVEAGCILADVNEPIRQLFRSFSYHLGLSFQIRDDILDQVGDEQTIGKPVGSDLSNKKSTYPSILTLKGAEEKLSYHIDAAKSALQKIGGNPHYLNMITDLVATRDH
ncbi:polyprenyl synthetase family protein [Bacillus litorisediminis]|uniref:polyprenyl synthetase family protein n=1 Tax=Bacillus litorisediminis TaxID=2922713 RepID=UPI001FACAE9C|nr:farnesyl diphosphate synthase [Bacillus litorisediminis]